MDRLIAVEGDITRQDVDAIVNAANASLLGGGGVDGAIHRAAGPELLAYCRTLNGCSTGSAKITPGFRLTARWVIHTSCYRSSMALAAQHGIRTLAFPQISTGVYRFPVERACRISVATIREGLRNYPVIEQVRCVSFGAAAHAAMQASIDLV